jgi:hypothetical protein
MEGLGVGWSELAVVLTISLERQVREAARPQPRPDKALLRVRPPSLTVSNPKSTAPSSLLQRGLDMGGGIAVDETGIEIDRGSQHRARVVAHESRRIRSAGGHLGGEDGRRHCGVPRAARRHLHRVEANQVFRTKRSFSCASRSLHGQNTRSIFLCAGLPCAPVRRPTPGSSNALDTMTMQLSSTTRAVGPSSSLQETG